jgi:hypothetical protein
MPEIAKGRPGRGSVSATHRLVWDGIAIASLLAASVVAIFPALIMLIVTLFYDSAGGVLVLLGSLISVLPHPTAPAQGGGGLPMFQVLQTGTRGLLVRSVLGTGACALALGLFIGCRRGRDRRPLLIALLCCLVASVACGWIVAAGLAPAALALAIRLRPRRHALPFHPHRPT